MANIANAQITIVDLSDPILSQTAPPTPTLDMLWLDTSVSPNILKRWDGKSWTIVNDTKELEEKTDSAISKADSVAKDLTTKVSQTDFNVANGKIEQLIKDDEIIHTDITNAKNDIVSINSKYNTISSDVEGTKSTVASLQSVTNSHTNQIQNMNNQITTVSNSLSGFKVEVSSTYMTQKDIDTAMNNLEIGGRNYARNTSNDWSGWFQPKAGTNIIVDHWSYIYPPEGRKVGDVFTVSVEIEWEKFTFTQDSGNIYFQGSVDNAWSVINIFASKFPRLKSIVTQDNGTTRLEVQTTIPYEAVTTATRFGFGIRCDYSDGTGRIRIRRLKVEEGNKATSWTPAPEDIDTNIANAKTDVTNTFNNTLKSYSTTTQMNSAIATSKDSILSSVSSTYATKADLTTANGDITALTTRMQSAEQKLTKDGITSIVSDYYTTKTEFNNLQVGGRNLALGTGTATGDVSKGGGEVIKFSDLFNGVSGIKTNTAWNGRCFNLKAIAQRGGFKVGDNLVLSVYIKSDENVTLNVTSHRTTGTGNIAGSTKSYSKFTVTPQWKQVWFPFTADEGSLNRIDARIEVNTSTDTNYIYWAGWKLEKGNRPTDWTPAPEDIDSSISSVSSNLQSQITQNANNINLKVSKDSIVSSINQTAESIKINASKIDLQGKVTFSMLDSNAQSTINNAQSTANTAKSSIDNLQVGGRNYIRGGKGDTKSGFFKNFDKVENGYGEKTLTSKKSYATMGLTDGFILGCRDYEVGSQVTISYDFMYTKWEFPTGSNRTEFWLGQRYTSAPSGETSTGRWVGVTQHTLPIVGQNGCELNKWIHITKTLTIPAQASSNVGTIACIQIYNSNADVSASITFRMKNVKLEYGNRATDYSPAPEDVDSSISSVSSVANSAKTTADSVNSTVSSNKSNWDKGKTAYDWTNANGTNMTNLRNMVLKWTDNAVSQTTEINGGWIKTNTITAEQIASNTILAENIVAGAITAEKLAVDAIKSRNYVADTSGSFLNLKDGTFDSKYLKWDTEGKLSATGGKIGGLTINENNLSFSAKGKIFISASIEGTTKFNVNTLDSGGFNTKILDWSFIDSKGETYSTGYISPDYIVSQHFKGDFINANKYIYAGDSTQAGQLMIYSGKTSVTNPYTTVSCDGNNLKVSTPVKATSFEATSESYFTKSGAAYKDPASGYNAAIKANGSIIISNNEGYYIGQNNLKITADSGDGYRVRISSNQGTSGGGIHLCCNYGVNVVNWDNNAFTLIRASAFNVSSLLEYKTNIKPLANPFEIIQAGDIYTYNLKQDIKNGMVTDCYGFVIGDGYNVPSNVLSYDKKTIDQYAMSGILWGATKELINKNSMHDEQLKKLENENAKLKQEIATLNAKLDVLIKKGIEVTIM